MPCCAPQVHPQPPPPFPWFLQGTHHSRPRNVPCADRTIPIAWLRFQQALQQEVAAAADADTMQHFSELMQLVELLCRARYSPDSRYLQSAMMLAQPQLSEEERQLLGSLDGGCAADPEASAPDLLDTPSRLLQDIWNQPWTVLAAGV